MFNDILGTPFVVLARCWDLLFFEKMRTVRHRYSWLDVRLTSESVNMVNVDDDDVVLVVG